LNFLQQLFRESLPSIISIMSCRIPL
jgi:hypothetical protein